MEKYYAIKKMSASTFKTFMKCENQGLAVYNGEYSIPQNKAMLIGSYVDSWCEGTLEEFKVDHPEIFKKDGTPKVDFILAETIIDKMQSDPVFMEYITGEKQVVRFGTIEGIEFKGKFDILTDDRIVDMKVMRSTERVMGKSLVDHWGYDIQLAIYQELEFQATGKKKPCFLAIATKEDGINLEIVEIEQYKLDDALEYVKKNLPRIKDIIEGTKQPMKCNNCEYCRITKKVTGPIPSEWLGLSDADIEFMKGESE